MKQTFVNNIQQLMTANQNQRIKINYLELQKQKREEYLSGLKESIMLNKQTLIVINQEGPNNMAIGIANKQNLHLIKINQTLYNENRQLNALLLMQQQLRVQDKSFYLQRIGEFQNRITDLRKYLHDKEESFSSVVGRLKKYEQWNQKPLAEKMEDTQGLRKMSNQILMQVLAERNMFQAKFEEVFPDAERYKLLESALRNGGGNLSRLISQMDAKTQDQNDRPLSQHDSPRKQLLDFHLNQRKKTQQPQQQHSKSSVQTNFKQTQVTKQLMRLLKKQKLNNQILENALHAAIEKNEQLIRINQNTESALITLQKNMEKLIALNHFLKLKIKQFASGYGRKYQLNRTKDQTQSPAYLQLFGLNFEIKDQDNHEVSSTVYKDLLKESLKEDVEKILKIPIPQHPYFQKRQSKNHIEEKGKQLQDERMGEEMTTNDMSRLTEKITNSKEDLKVEESQNINKQNGSRLTEKQMKMMIKSASEPRIAIQWEETETNGEHQAEQIVVDEF